ncbi:uncharacterized protein [Salminus brasiliensis]|uniref:uncharacterized protein n=1 Tax=Salminus brasiliensis TaxID=930266 RepID=UPI003B837511
MDNWQHQKAMKLQHLLWITIFMPGPCMAGNVNRTGARTSSKVHPHPETSQLELLSLGQKQLFSDLGESARQLAEQDSLVALELAKQMRALKEIRRRRKEVVRAGTQVRADLQLFTARGERLQTAAWRLRNELGALKASQDGAVGRMRKILAIVLLLSGSASQTHSPVNITQLKTMVDSQSRRLSSLSMELTNQDEVMEERQKVIADLEEQVSDQGAKDQGA